MEIRLQDTLADGVRNHIRSGLRRSQCRHCESSPEKRISRILISDCATSVRRGVCRPRLLAARFQATEGILVAGMAVLAGETVFEEIGRDANFWKPGIDVGGTGGCARPLRSHHVKNFPYS